jgi:ABC-2 type transport system permease protein
MYYYAARQQAAWAEAVRFVSVLSQIQSMGQGRLDFRTIALHLSVCLFALFLTVKVLEIHRSRG